MITRKLYFKLLIRGVVLILLTGCASNDKFKDARQYSSAGNYVPAILLYDKYIQKNHHSAEQTIAELERSNCYYELGMQAYSKKNWVLADRLLFLANSDKADKLADNVHLELARKAAEDGDIAEELRHYDYVIDHIPDSELVPVMLRKRIDIYLLRNQKVSAWLDYRKLWDDHPDSPEAISATEVINPLIPWLLQHPRNIRNNGEFQAAIMEFQIYADYPTSYQNEIYQDIGLSYYQWAMKDLENKDYVQMCDHLAMAVTNDPLLKQDAEKEKEQVCQGFILTGDELLDSGEIQKAIESYQMCFMVLPDNSLAQDKIEHAREQHRRFAEADSLFAQAEKQENRKEYKKAKGLYQESYKLSGKILADEKSKEMDNYIKAETDPRTFALEIIRDYKKGLIKRNVDKKLTELTKQFGDQVSSSDWKAVYSYGEFNFEVRIDIFSPSNSYYFAWRVNLIERTVSPLNKDSESMMK